MVLIEAMYFGLPVVSFSCESGPREIICDGENGLLAEEENAIDLAEKIEMLMRNRDLCERMGKSASRSARRFEKKKILDQWEKFCRRIIDEYSGMREGMAELISIIVPMYNSERYIRECIASIQAQTYSYYEVILIDDGSYDESITICNKICRQDKRIRLIAQEHKGVSSARNKGIEEAGGKYIFFMDSDDIIHPQLLEALYLLLEKSHAAMATEGYCFISREMHKRKVEWRYWNRYEIESYSIDCKEAIKRLSMADREAMLYTIGGKMICRESLCKLRFNQKITHAEDTLFIYQMLNYGIDVSILCCDWYGYRNHKGCVTRSVSIESCQCRYRVNSYIRNQESENRRMENAVIWERVILNAMINWYRAGRGSGDINLVRHVKNLAERERRQTIFKQVNINNRIIFYLAFRCW